MHVYARIVEFGASAGALEGYVYGKRQESEMDMQALDIWTNNLLEAYALFQKDVLNEIQQNCDRTVGRAVLSLTPVLGESHNIVERLKSMVAGANPESPDDFQKKKWYQAGS
jgi:hypothetical protein